MRAALLLLLAGYAAAQGVGPPAPVPSSNTPAPAPAASSSQNPAPAPAPTPSSSQNAPAPAQSQNPPAQSQPPASSASPVYTGSPTFVFQSLATATQCTNAQIRWDLRNADRTKYAVDLYAYNIGVDQAIPPAPSPSSAAAPANTPAANTPAANTPAANTPAANNNNNANANTQAASPAPAASAAAPAQANNANAQASNPPASQAVGGGAARPVKRDGYGPDSHRNPLLPKDNEYVHLVARADINSTVVKGWRTHISFGWTVDVPPGRYRLLAIVNDEARTWAESPDFTVVASTNTTCVKDTSDATKTNSGADAGQTTGNASAGSGSEETDSKKSGLSGGAIAGVVIAVLAGLALAILAFICFRRAARDKRRHAGGREPQTPMRNLIGAPTDFRKTKGARASMGHALAAIGIGANRNGDRMERAERGEKPMFPAVPRMNMASRRGSEMTQETDNPFETAPTTPVEEKSPSHTPGSSFGTSIPPASALAAGAAAARDDSNDSHSYPPRSPPRGVYDGIDDEPDTFRRPSASRPRSSPQTSRPARSAQRLRAARQVAPAPPRPSRQALRRAHRTTRVHQRAACATQSPPPRWRPPPPYPRPPPSQ
jgi:hypothetical protein